MFTETFINEFVRDQQTWRRAARQRSEPDCLDPSTPAAKANMGSIFRQGCVTSVCSLKFLNRLRDAKENPKIHRRLLAWERWDPSTRITGEGADPMHELLLRHLVHKGFASGYEAASDLLLQRHKTDLAQRKQYRRAQKAQEGQRQMTALRCVVVDEELRPRNAIVSQESRLREDLVKLLWEEMIVIFLNSEFVARRAIFQNAVEEFNQLARREDAALESLLGMPNPFHRVYMNIICREPKRRLQIVLELKEQRDALRSHFQRKTHQLIEYELTRMAEKERVLMKFLRLSRQRTKS